MSPQARTQIQQDLQLIERFAHTYNRRFSQLIEKLNASPDAQVAAQCLRLCVEAVNMLLVSQDRLTNAIRHLSPANG